MTKLWLDDIRPCPDNWVHAKSVREAIRILETGTVTHASLDHDLGEFAYDGGDGTALVDYMAESGNFPTVAIRVHSANPVGRSNMLSTIDRYGPYTNSGIAHRSI